ncbi:site-specific integrase [Couchioplanes caeruleus]|uniref:site-specific integrase n=1 Tax=Couchioplanes caeruleus TaxID=56438 RepID=UPI0020C0C1AA|nr:site-specific integrase [Couchioplanes caeruleus]UQU67469.1 site-specific integrase [Couchioplanes caeruleus]
MEIFYVDRRMLGLWSVPAGFDAGSTLDYRSLPDGMPVLLDASMQPVEPASGWFRALAYDGKDAKTLRAYAYIVRRLITFLNGRGADLISATESDLVAYRRSRTELQDKPIDEVTWDREATVINALYGHLLDRRLVRRRPFRLTRRGSQREAANSLQTGKRREMKVRHMTVEQYLYFRDVGLGGQHPDGEVSQSFRGLVPHRGRAGLELALLTGMRLQEWSTVLLPELQQGQGPGEPVEFELQKCAKFGLRRDAYVPVAALEMVAHYLLLEREEFAATSAESLARRRADLFVVNEIDAEQRRLSGVLEGRRRSFVMSAMSPQLRRITVREAERGLEPLAVFIGRGGLMLGPSSWDRIRKDAWRRMLQYAAAPGVPVLPAQPWRFHDGRHTFALQLLRFLQQRRVQQEIDDNRARGLPTPAEHISIHPLLTVQRRLGHKRPASTYAYLRYLEDPRTYIDAAFAEWSEHDGATYAAIGLHALTADRKAAPDAPTR